MSGMIRVAIVETSTHTRRALSARLLSISGIEVAWALPTVPMAVERLSSGSGIDSLLLDASSLEGDALPALLAALRARSDIPVFLLTSEPTQAHPQGPWAGIVPKPRPGQDPGPEWPADPLGAFLRRGASLPASQSTLRRQADVILIGLSTGGPTALELLAPEWPKNLAAPILVVQHVMTGFDQALVDTMARRTRLTVGLGREGAPILPGTVTLAPAGRHMVVRPGAVPVIGLDDGPPEQSCRPAVDPLFRSAAEVYGARALAVVLTGMGEDGLRGAKALKSRGATILAQDEKTSVVWGMPGAVVRAGLADLVLPLEVVSREICLRAGLSA